MPQSENQNRSAAQSIGNIFYWIGTGIAALLGVSMLASTDDWALSLFSFCIVWIPLWTLRLILRALFDKKTKAPPTEKDDDFELIIEDDGKLGITITAAEPERAKTPKPRGYTPLPTNETRLNERWTLPAGTFRFVAVDVETANAHVGSICQIGLAFVGENNEIAVRTHLIDPEDSFDTRNIGIHSIHPEDVEGKPNFAEIFQEIAPVLRKNKLVQHSNFDSRAIRAACQDYDITPPRFAWHDSLKIAQTTWPEFKGNGGHGLAHLKDALNLDFNHHDAGEDARAAAMITLKAEELNGQDFKTLANTSPKRTHAPAVKMDGDATGTLFGQVAVFTGALSISRTEAATIAAQAGITTKASVSRKVTLLVVGDQDLEVLAPGQTKSTKHRKAEDLIESGHDIRIIGETEFLSIVKAT